jgi:PilZ domain-containing protein
VLVDGNLALLVDLSTIGAQVLSPTVLKPNQRVRMALSDEHSSVRFNASVAWASFEIPRNTNPRYRAGIEFIDADKSAVNAYLARHKQA